MTSAGHRRQRREAAGVAEEAVNFAVHYTRIEFAQRVQLIICPITDDCVG